MTNKTILDLKQRKHPARGVFIEFGKANIVFLTVCTKNRTPWLVHPSVHSSLVAIWSDATAWAVGKYVIMPDHIHLFCAPSDLSCSLHNWITYWKRMFSRKKIQHAGEWQRDFWDTRLRRHENYSEKWEYVRNNPVRAGLVKNSDEWPYQGMLHLLPW